MEIPWIRLLHQSLLGTYIISYMRTQAVNEAYHLPSLYFAIQSIPAL
jgi:hypothetical protein